MPKFIWHYGAKYQGPSYRGWVILLMNINKAIWEVSFFTIYLPPSSIFGRRGGSEWKIFVPRGGGQNGLHFVCIGFFSEGLFSPKSWNGLPCFLAFSFSDYNVQPQPRLKTKPFWDQSSSGMAHPDPLPPLYNDIISFWGWNGYMTRLHKSYTP